ncbi:hypothetical protein KCP73_25670 [Salmonella enterica subsp. enterica]|nr:hypothetical protein KCP73_25670 [Salmonella enterica subsp. enterica]
MASLHGLETKWCKASKLKYLVVIDHWLTETSTFWQTANLSMWSTFEPKVFRLPNYLFLRKGMAL